MKRQHTLEFIVSALMLASVSIADQDSVRETPAGRDTAKDTPQFTENSTITDYLNYAFLNNPALLAAEAKAASKAASADQSGYLADPELSFEYMLEQRDMQYRIGLTQHIPGFGKLRLKKQIAQAQAAAAGHDTEAMRLMVFELVINSFHNYHYLRRTIEVTDDNIALLADLEKVILSRYKANSAKYSDVLKVQVEKDKLLNHRASLLEMRVVRSAELSLLLDLPTKTVLPWPKLIPSDSATLSDDVLEDMLPYLNPELKAMDSTVEGLASMAKLAKKGPQPNYMIGAGYSLMPEMEDGSTPSDVGLMVGVSLPLWWGKYKAETREAELALESTKLARKGMENGLQLDLKKAIFELQDADRQIALLKKSLIPKSQQAFEVAKQEFMTGDALFMTLIDAQRTLFDLSLNLARAEADREMALGEIGCCVGKFDFEALKKNGYKSKTKSEEVKK